MNNFQNSNRTNFFFEKLLKESFIYHLNNDKYFFLIKDIQILENKKKNKKQQSKNQAEVGYLLGEKIKKLGKNKFIVKANTGTRYIVLMQTSEKKEEETEWIRIALDFSFFSIMKILPNNIEPLIFKILNENIAKTLYQNIGGLKKEIEKLREIIELPLVNPEIFYQIGAKIPKGILLYGPPGTGKTLLAKYVSHNVKAKFLKLVGSSVVDKYIGESARIIREIFIFAKKNNPSVIFIDEIDAIGGRRFSEGSSADREIQRTLIELLNQIDGFEELSIVKIIMATNRPDVLDPALLRPGRLDRKLKIDLPNVEARYQIFKIYFKIMNQESFIDFAKIMRMCEYFNGSDLRNLCTEAGLFAARCHRVAIREDDLVKAVKKIKVFKKIEIL
jgi:26S proteasome regulatory subunit T4